jgi:transposase
VRKPTVKAVPPVSAGTQGGRRPTGVPADTSTEVVARPTRRRHTTAYKIKVLDTVASLRHEGHGAIGSYLRKEGLYYSSVANWERLQKQGLLTAKQRGPREKSRDALAAEVKKLRRKLEQTEKRLAKTEMIVDLQKKLSKFMEAVTPENFERNVVA